jgi:hypothetical protein
MVLKTGLRGEPFYTDVAPMASTGASLLQNWGTGIPPGGQGSCLVQFKGASYNGSCDKERHFGCEEKPLPPGVTTTVYFIFSLVPKVLLDSIPSLNSAAHLVN